MTPYELQLQESDDGAVIHIVLSGELDLTNARELELRLDEAAPAQARLVVDLSRVSFIDSAALHVLFKLARMRGHDLVIVVEPTAQIARTLAIAGLDRAVAVVPSLESVTPPANIG